MRKKILLSSILILTLCTSCSVDNEPLVINEDIIKDPYGNEADYLLAENFDNKEVTLRDKEVYAPFSFIGPTNSGVHTVQEQISVAASVPDIAINTSGTSADASTSLKGGFVWPLSKAYPVTSLYKWRWGRMHNGIDIGVPEGTPILASKSGTIIHDTWENQNNHSQGGGVYIGIDHGDGTYTWYMHCHTKTLGIVKNGQKVQQGQVIGYSGNTGHSTGPHLHFQIMIGGLGNKYAQNPLLYVKSPK